MITKEGITNWIDANDIIWTFFYTEKETTILVGVIAKGTSEISITYNDKTESLKRK